MMLTSGNFRPVYGTINDFEKRLRMGMLNSYGM